MVYDIAISTFSHWCHQNLLRTILRTPFFQRVLRPENEDDQLAIEAGAWVLNDLSDWVMTSLQIGFEHRGPIFSGATYHFSKILTLEYGIQNTGDNHHLSLSKHVLVGSRLHFHHSQEHIKKKAGQD